MKEQASGAHSAGQPVFPVRGRRGGQGNPERSRRSGRCPPLRRGARPTVLSMWIGNNPNGQSRGSVRPAGTGTPGTARLYFLVHPPLFLIVLVVTPPGGQPYGPADWWLREGAERAPALARWTHAGRTFLINLFFPGSAY